MARHDVEFRNLAGWLNVRVQSLATLTSQMIEWVSFLDIVPRMSYGAYQDIRRMGELSKEVTEGAELLLTILRESQGEPPTPILHRKFTPPSTW